MMAWLCDEAVTSPCKYVKGPLETGVPVITLLVVRQLSGDADTLIGTRYSVLGIRRGSPREKVTSIYDYSNRCSIGLRC